MTARRLERPMIIRSMAFILALLIGMPGNLSALAPETQINDDWTKLSYLLQTFDQKYGGEKSWRQPSQKLEEQLEAAARHYWNDPDMEIEIILDKKHIVFASGPAANRNRFYVLSAVAPQPGSDRKILNGASVFTDRGIRKSVRGSSMRVKSPQAGPYILRAYDFGYSKRFYGKVTGATLVTALGVASLWKQIKGWMRSLWQTGVDTVPGDMDADLVMIYGPHYEAEFLHPQVELLAKYVKQHQKKYGMDVSNIVFIQEFILSWKEIMVKLRQAYPQDFPQLSLNDGVALLQNPRAQESLRALYQGAMIKLNEYFERIFDGKKHPEGIGQEPVDPRFKELWDYLRRNGIRANPEPMSFESWIDASLAELFREISHNALKARDLKGFVHFQKKKVALLVSSMPDRDRSIADMISERRRVSDPKRYVGIRGYTHKESRQLYTDRNYSYGELIPEDSGRNANFLENNFYAKRLQSPEQVVREEDAEIIYHYLYENILNARMKVSHKVVEADEFAHGTLAKIGSKAQVYDWFEHVLKSAPTVDNKGEYILSALKSDARQLVRPGDLAYLGGGILWAPPAGMPQYLSHKSRVDHFAESLRQQGVSEATVKSMLALISGMKVLARYDAALFPDERYREAIDDIVTELTRGEEKAFFQMVRCQIHREILREYLASSEGWGLIMRNILGIPDGNPPTPRNPLFQPVLIGFWALKQGVALSENDSQIALDAAVEIFAQMFEGPQSNHTLPVQLRMDLDALKESMRDAPIFRALTAGGIEALGYEAKQTAVLHSKPIVDFLYARADVETLDGPLPAQHALQARLHQLLAKIKREIMPHAGPKHIMDSEKVVLSYA